MITKILFTLSIIVALVIYMRMKKDQESVAAQPVRKKVLTENEKMFRQGAYLFLIFMVISAVVVMYFELGDRYATVNVHVINTQTGERMTYQAEQQDIKSNQFKTLQGRTVFVADIERVEIEPQ